MATEDNFEFKQGSEDRRKLTFPKGKAMFQHYSRSGLIIEDLNKELPTEQELVLRLALREWNNSDPETDGKPFDEDSCELEMKELAPKTTKEGKRASRIFLHAKTSEAAQAEFGSCLIFEDFLDDDKPAHIYEDDSGTPAAGDADGMEAKLDEMFNELAPDVASAQGEWKDSVAKVKFPKGKVELRHYTTSGLFMWDEEQTGEDHMQNVELRLCTWNDDGPEVDPIAKFFARDKASAMDEEAVTIGLLHTKTDTGVAVIDWEDGKDDHEMQSLVHHRGDSSYLSFRDKDKEGKDLKIELKHQAGDYLQIESENEDDVMYKLNHHNDAGFKVFNTGGDTTLFLYHASGAKVVINPDGTIEAESPVKLKGKAPEIEFEGNTKVIGDLKVEGNVDVTGDITFGGSISGPGGNWHPG